MHDHLARQLTVYREADLARDLKRRARFTDAHGSREADAHGSRWATVRQLFFGRPAGATPGTRQVLAPRPANADA